MPDHERMLSWHLEIFLIKALSANDAFLSKLSMRRCFQEEGKAPKSFAEPLIISNLITVSFSDLLQRSLSLLRARIHFILYYIYTAFELLFEIHFAMNMTSVARLLARLRRIFLCKKCKTFYKMFCISYTKIFAWCGILRCNFGYNQYFFW